MGGWEDGLVGWLVVGFIQHELFKLLRCSWLCAIKALLCSSYIETHYLIPLKPTSRVPLKTQFSSSPQNLPYPLNLQYPVPPNFKLIYSEC